MGIAKGQKSGHDPGEQFRAQQATKKTCPSPDAHCPTAEEDQLQGLSPVESSAAQYVWYGAIGGGPPGNPGGNFLAQVLGIDFDQGVEIVFFTLLVLLGSE